MPLIVTTITTRTSGIDAPPASRKTVYSGEFLLSEKRNWKPLALSAWEVTSTETSALSTSWDTGTGTAGPIISERWIPLSIRGGLALPAAA